MTRVGLVLSVLLGSTAVAAERPASPVFDAAERAVSTWRTEAADHLVLASEKADALRGSGPPPSVARCIKLNNYWCIKKAGWDGELAADREGHVAFSSAVEGAAVAALLLKRYYVDFDRKTAMAIISRWAPAECGLIATGSRAMRSARAIAPKGVGNTLRARWLAGHARGFVTPLTGKTVKPRKSVVADHISRSIPAPTIAVGLGEPSRPMTLDAFLMSSPNAPPSRSMLGMPRTGKASPGTVSGCGSDSMRIANYAAKAAAGIDVTASGDLGLFDKDGAPTPNLAIMMTNMAQVEIGPDAASSALVQAGIAAALKPGRNDKPTNKAKASGKTDQAKETKGVEPGKPESPTKPASTDQQAVKESK